ncbi:quinone oxidoreductase family protein [Rhodomicrobium lacus]|uniref:quinone oxidoreductase family protein n=1 Tax=Rhodomicrobium lacus TaxID=2498452 RepID=UPI0026E45AC6|nr:quinone oxidoreductase [Rhodomicrobium lacus]WKW52278.1 quinone oxidoreductase [Rhodomicrobium lacus]
MPRPTHAIRIHAYGGPDVLRWEEVEVGAPGPGQVKIRQHAAGVNYIDVYHRTGLYPQPSFPFTPGSEGAGEVVALGEGVTDLAVGDHVAYAGALGGYAEERLIQADRLVKIPSDFPYETAAAMMLQGMTVRYLLKETYPVKKDTVLLWHAAAGGVGLIASQWAHHIGATIIGTAGSDEKAQLARSHGCTHVINYRTENFVERVKEITGGRGVDVVYDSVGKDTFPGSLDCLRPRGLFVSFGNASGPVPPFELGLLSQKGSLYATRPTLNTYIATRDQLVANANDVIDMVQLRRVKINIGKVYRLSEAVDAHRALEARETTGSIVLLPDYATRRVPSAHRSTTGDH